AGLYAEGVVDELDPEDWDAVFAANVRSCFLTIQAALPTLRESGGAIVTMSSFNGLTGIPGNVSAYGAAKAAVINLTRSLALDLAPTVRVNCIAPGFVETEKLLATPSVDDLMPVLNEMTPIGRIGRPEEIAHALVFAFENEFLNGATINIDGGRCASG
ncbi:MAG: SDR family NAD(P)-dependent oxidoreductase, partial [Solirubrobacterales bacterium]